MRESVLNEFKQQDWPRIIKELVAYTHLRLGLWGLAKSRGVKGYEPKDIAFKAIELVLEGDWRWDPDKGELLPYLKYHVVKGLIANLARNAEVVSMTDVASQIRIERVDQVSHEDELNASMVMEEIKTAIQDDAVLLLLVEGLSTGLKRSEICELHHLDEDMYDNAIRRLRTRLIQLERKGLYTINYGRAKSK